MQLAGKHVLSLLFTKFYQTYLTACQFGVDLSDEAVLGRRR